SEEYESALITPDDPKQWFFVAPTSPPVFFLDSRTRRKENQLGKENNQPSNLPSALMNDEAIGDLIAEANQHNIKGGWLVIVAQTPIFGNPRVEAFIEAYGPFNPAYYDLEMWHANRAGFYSILHAIHSIRPRGCLILSGDVHYGFVARASVTYDK